MWNADFNVVSSDNKQCLLFFIFCIVPVRRDASQLEECKSIACIDNDYK
jgi:hypothetical protein